MEELIMAVLLKNLQARLPRPEDFAALAELVRLCESEEQGMASGSLESLWFESQRPDFHLADDAWVISTTRGQLVGFACIWCKEAAYFTTFLCVHPEYRNRGIGTLLLRLVEMRARQALRQAPASERVVLQGLLNAANAGAQRLFEREGYQAGQAFLRVSFVLHGEDASATRRQTVDIGLEAPAQPLAVTPLHEQDALCNVHLYRTYEKELRPAASCEHEAPADLQALSA
jgi:GNAT superfamily N-acetyltransferase